jgi:hypothetical protein
MPPQGGISYDQINNNNKGPEKGVPCLKGPEKGALCHPQHALHRIPRGREGVREGGRAGRLFYKKNIYKVYTIFLYIFIKYL